MSRPVITFTTDFGPAAPAVCRGVMYGIAPDALIIDISHQVRRYAIREGAGTLVFALPYMPIGVHVAVVDPGVGTDRRGIALKVVRGDMLLGPDNGLLLPAAERLGGIVAARALENRAFMLPVVTSSFHGRDVFAPIAAHLAMGSPFEAVGPAIDPATLVRLDLPTPTIREGELESRITHVLIFGNVTFAGTTADLEAAIGPLTPGRRVIVEFPAHDGRPAVVETTVWERTFGSVPLGASLLMEDSEGNLSLADNQGNAAERLGLALDRPVRIRAA
ncbi:MAG TPA: SAM-dependent chlorinase/fluorinase [Candidatus Sulfomarinibacteraceae bacterium]|nr:SAM-dependent chlorinase/fluorinase [Candidatus Sulfomarinibacteraceae bacterium]